MRLKHPFPDNIERIIRVDESESLLGLIEAMSRIRVDPSRVTSQLAVSENSNKLSVAR